MSLIATAASASAATPTISFPIHGHKKGVHADSSTASGSSGSSQAPATTQGLFSSLLQSLEQVIGLPAITSSTAAAASTAATAASAATAATGASAATTAAASSAGVTTAAAGTAPNPAQDLQSFLHTLFQALKADGLGSSAGTTGSVAQSTTAAAATPGSSAGTATSAGAGQYEGSLVSSLQTLIQQLGTTGPTSAAASNLSASFNNLVQGVSGSAAAASSAGGSSTASNPSSNSSLQSFLSSLLQTVQREGHSLSSLGTNVNANA